MRRLLADVWDKHGRWEWQCALCTQNWLTSAAGKPDVVDGWNMQLESVNAPQPVADRAPLHVRAYVLAPAARAREGPHTADRDLLVLAPAEWVPAADLAALPGTEYRYDTAAAERALPGHGTSAAAASAPADAATAGAAAASAYGDPAGGGSGAAASGASAGAAGSSPRHRHGFGGGAGGARPHPTRPPDTDRRVWGQP
jgi:hypothetical protein